MSIYSVCDRCGDNGLKVWADKNGHLRRVRLTADGEPVADALWVCKACEEELAAVVERQFYSIAHGISGSEDQ